MHPKHPQCPEPLSGFPEPAPPPPTEPPEQRRERILAKQAGGCFSDYVYAVHCLAFWAANPGRTDMTIALNTLVDFETAQGNGTALQPVGRRPLPQPLPADGGRGRGSRSKTMCRVCGLRTNPIAIGAAE